jgi:hypothetical protein
MPIHSPQPKQTMSLVSVACGPISISAPQAQAKDANINCSAINCSTGAIGGLIRDDFLTIFAAARRRRGISVPYISLVPMGDSSR